MNSVLIESEGIDYLMPDMLRLKMGLEMESIYRQLDEMSLILRIKKVQTKSDKNGIGKSKSRKKSSNKK